MSALMKPKEDDMNGNQRIWRADAAKSRLGFTLRHLVLSQISGEVRKWRATIVIDSEDPSRSSVEAFVDAGSLDTADPERDQHMRSEEFLNVAAFPEMHFRSRRVIPIDTRRFTVVGDLTIRDVTREVELELDDGGRERDESGVEHATFRAHATINRQDFGLRWNQDLDTGGVVVGDKVDLSLALEAVAEREFRTALA
jgi:polyisoprenoid-binding protein YceI